MDSASLQQKLMQIDGRGYKAYGQIRGAYRFPRFTLFVDYVQGDPFATPSRLRVRVAQADAGFDARLFENQARCVALEDFIARAFSAAIGRIVQGNRGTGKSGFMGVDRGGQEILERTAALVTDRFVEVRFVAGLPADGRRCLGREAAAMLLDELPRLVDASLFLKALDPGAVYGHVEAAEDQEWLRGQLQEKHLVAFVADGRELVACRDDAVKIRAEDGRRVEKVDISPFIDQVSNLYREHGVSTVLVMGGSGEYFEVADTVIAM